MQAIVHFTVGVVFALAILTIVDRPVQQEFVVFFLSGFWAMIPDGHWLLREAGFNDVASAWRAVHGTPTANIFWFHQLIDSIETGRDNLEAGLSLGILFILVLTYYHFNDWSSE